MPDDNSQVEAEAVAQETPTPQAQAKPEARPEVKPDALANQKLTITVAEWQANQAKLNEYAQYKAAEAEREEKKNQEKLKLMAEKEGSDKALAAQREQLKVKEKEWADKYTSLHQSIAAEKVDGVIAQAIMGKQFIGNTPEVQAEAARDFQDIIRASGRFSASQDSEGRWSVKETATGRDAKEVLAEIVKAKSYLFKATTGGGVDLGGGRDAHNDAEKTDAVRQHEQWLAANQTNSNLGLFPVSSRN